MSKYKYRKPNLKGSKRKGVKVEILRRLSRKGSGEVSQAKISSKIGCSKPQVAFVALEMEDEGLISRTRVRNWKMTKEGEAYLKAYNHLLPKAGRPRNGSRKINLPKAMALAADWAEGSSPISDSAPSSAFAVTFPLEVELRAKVYAWESNSDSLRGFVESLKG